MKKFSLALLALAMALAITPAALADSYSFSFTNATFQGSGTFDVAGGVIDSLTGDLFSGTTDIGAMILDAPGTFASNDNAFTNAAPWLTESGLSFNVGGVNYNIFYYATDANYGVNGSCSLGSDCITNDPYGNPSASIDFSASAVTPVPEPSSLLLIGTGLLGLAMVFLRKARPSHSMTLSM